eukprot:GFYU01015524.1.p1 GENE.GFYU01015524.1~~GFYU01015524.1.p1  ORF type:complete len:540 (+),score=73.89 GFYU01015524.1:77-1696(+)
MSRKPDFQGSASRGGTGTSANAPHGGKMTAVGAGALTEDSPLLGSYAPKHTEAGTQQHPGSYLYSFGFRHTSELVPMAGLPKQVRSHTFTPSQRRSLLAVYLVVLCCDSSRGVVIPSLWPMLQELGGTKTDLGWAVAAIVLGRLVAAPVLGYWCNHRPYREVILFSLLMFLFGNLLYAGAWDVWVVVVSRVIVGFSIANIAVVRSFVSIVTPVWKRTVVFSDLGALQLIGITLSPGIASLLSYADFSLGNVHVTSYTAPAWFLVVCGILCTFAMTLLFDEETAKKTIPPVPETRPSIDSSSVSHWDAESVTSRPGLNSRYDVESVKKMKPEDEPLPKKGLAVCIVEDFGTRAIFSAVETLIVPITTAHFHWSVRETGAYMSVFGGGAILSLILLRIYSAGHEHIACGGYALLFSDRFLLIGSVIFMMIGTLVLVPWGGHFVPAQFFFGMLLIICVGYPFAHTLVVSIFSKLLGFRKQGTMQGWLASTASAGHIAGALWAGVGLDLDNGEMLVILSLTGLAAMSATVMLAWFPHLKIKHQ